MRLTGMHGGVGKKERRWLEGRQSGDGLSLSLSEGLAHWLTDLTS